MEVATEAIYIKEENFDQESCTIKQEEFDTDEEEHDFNYEEYAIKQEELIIKDENFPEVDPKPHVTPPNLRGMAATATLELLPQKSRLKYEKQYAIFMEWCQKNKAEHITEKVFLAYFSSKAATCKSPTLWSTYSMLKSTFAVKNNVDISEYAQLVEFLKKQNVGCVPNKSKSFSRDELNKFLREAPNESYLMWKVCLLVGVAGACRRDELRKMRVDHIANKNGLVVITVPEDSKNGNKRTFTLTSDSFEEVNSLELFFKYAALRPRHCNHKSFFVNYKLGRCSTKVVGVHTFAKIPGRIAKYLNLPDPTAYTGHCYRRTSATLFPDSSAGKDIEFN